MSLYAKEKVSAERYIEKNAKDFSFQSVILRFSTAFGCAPRMRFDLSINEFVRDIYMGKLLEVYDSETWRPYCHTKDFGELIKKILESDREYFGEIFNAGSDENNATKKMIVENIIKYIPKAKVKFVEGGFDKRNYKVDFTKVKEHFNFSPKWTIDRGIKEIVEKLKEGEFLSESENKNFYGNYFIRGKD